MTTNIPGLSGGPPDPVREQKARRGDSRSIRTAAVTQSYSSLCSPCGQSEIHLAPQVQVVLPRRKGPLARRSEADVSAEPLSSFGRDPLALPLEAVGQRKPHRLEYTDSTERGGATLGAHVVSTVDSAGML